MKTKDGGIDYNKNNSDEEMTEKPESSAEDVIEKDEPEKAKLSLRDVVVIASMLLVAFLFACAYSLLAPFFPKEAAKKGVSTTMTGIIFGCYEFVNTFFAPVAGLLMSKVVPKYMYIAGCVVGVVTTTLYGFVDMATDGTFTALCLVLRIIDAIAASSVTCCAMTMLTSLYPQKMSALIGATETVIGLGFMVGPAIGGALYQAGGFRLPFFVVGGLMLLCIFAPIILIPKQSMATDKVQENTPPKLRLITRPAILVSLLVSCFSSMCISFQNPILGKHLEQFHLGTGIVGLVFVIGPGCYAISAPFIGLVVDKYSCGKTFLFCAVLGLSVVYLLFGPSPIFHVQSALWITAVALVLMGLGVGAAFIPVFSLILEEAKTLGFPDSSATKGIVSGIVMCPFYLGAAIGPIIAGALDDSVGYGWATSVVSVIGLVVTIIVGITYAILKCQRRPLSEMEAPIIADDKSDKQNESSHMLMGKITTYSSQACD